MESDPRPIGPDISGWTRPAVAIPPQRTTYWHVRREYYLIPKLVAELECLGYGRDDLWDLDLEDASILALRAAEQFDRSGLAGMTEAAEYLGLAAIALRSAHSLRDALPHIANVNLRLALRDLAAGRAALAASIPDGRPAGTQELTA